MTSQARASAAATIESAKRVAESVWTIEHARVCACSAASRPCVVYGCAKAKRALAALAGAAAPPDQAASSAGESGSDDGFSDGDDVAAVRAVLAHREACAWADPARGRGITRSTRPCLVCCLASRARAVPDAAHPGLLRLDFSSRCGSGAGCFAVPPGGGRRLLMTRSDTTEELALLLSDMSGRKRARANSEDSGLTAASKPVVSDAEDDVLLSLAARVPDDGAAPPGGKRARTASVDDEAATGSPVASSKRPKAPRISVAAPPARLSPTPHASDAAAAPESPTTPVSPPPSEAGDDELDAKPRPAAARPALAAAPAALAAAPSPLSPRSADAVRAIPRSPSFSAAASSLLGLSASCTKQKPSLSPSKALPSPLATISSLKAC